MEESKGIYGMTSVATPASADAVTQANQCGNIAVVGLHLMLEPYVNSVV